jgi:hypothetical protein
VYTTGRAKTEITEILVEKQEQPMKSIALTLCTLALLVGCSGTVFQGPVDKNTLFGAVERGDAETVRRCIKAGIKLNEPRIPGGKLPLSYAVEALHVEIVQILLEAGADPLLALPRSPEGQGHAIIRQLPSPMVEAQGFLVASQLAGPYPIARHSLKARQEVTGRWIDVLADPQFDEKMKTILELMYKYAKPPAREPK